VKGKLRYILIAIGALLLVLIALPFFIDANSFRPMIEQQLSAALGRKVGVANLSLSILSGALGAENLSISDDPSFSQSPFLTAKSLNVDVELWPLITSRNLIITGLTIDRPEVTLIRNAQGQWNFSTLATGGAPPSSTAANASPQAKPATGASSPPVVAKSGGSAAPEFTIQKLRLEKGRVTIGSTMSDKKSVYDNVDLEAANLSLKSQFPVLLTADASLSPLDMKVTVNSLDLAKTGFVDPGAGLGGIVDVTNTLQSNNGLARAEGNVKMKQLQLVKGGAPSGVPVAMDFKVDYDLPKSAGVINQGSVKIGKAVSRLSGTFDQRGESAVLDLKLVGKDLPVQDLQAALPAFGVILPKGSSLQTGTLSTNLNIQGPVDKLVTTGNVGLFNAKLAGFDMASKMAALSAFSGIPKAAGDTSIQKLTTNVRVAPEGIQTTNLDLVIPAIGELNGGGTIGSNSALNLKMVATLSAQSGVASAVGGLTGRTMSKNARIPFMIQGTASDPKFVPDVGGIVGSTIESELGKASGGDSRTKGLGDALGGILGGKKKK
jgi:AsmA protein